MLKYLLILMVITAEVSCSTVSLPDRSPSTPTPFSILQGLTWNQGALISIMRAKSQGLHYYQVTEPASSPGEVALTPKTFEVSTSPWVVDHIQVSFAPSPQGDAQPPPSLTYFIEIRDNDHQLLDRRQIGQVNLDQSDFQVAIASCMDDRFEEDQDQIWHDLAKDNPQYLFMIGDNVYATSILKIGEKFVDKDRLWERYVETRQKLAIFFLPALIPTLAQWDDHDYGSGDGDKTHPYRQEAQEVFRAFFPQNSDIPGVFSHGPSNAAVFTAFQTSFIFLDNRSEREPKGVDPGKFAHYGKDQEEWLFQQLKAHSGPTWLLQGDQFFGGYHRWDSFEGNHPKSFAHFLKDLKKHSGPLLFISGDRHLTEISRIGPPDLTYKSYEFTSSPIHARTYPSQWDQHPNPRQIAGADLNINYMLLEGKSAAHRIDLKVTSKTKHQKILFTRDLHISH